MIYITGDTHGLNDIGKLNHLTYQLDKEKFFHNKKKKPINYMIVAGDFGVLWNHRPDEREHNLLGLYNNMPWITLFIDGNHENFYRIYDLPQVKMFNGVVGKVTNKIYHLRRGEIYDIDGKSILTFGGAYSIDRNYRMLNVSYWEEEIPSEKERLYCLDNLEKHNNEVDIIVTHTCPNHAKNIIIKRGHNLISKFEDSTVDFLDKIHNVVKFKKWYFGHFHCDIVIDNKMRCLYHDIDEIN